MSEIMTDKIPVQQVRSSRLLYSMVGLGMLCALLIAVTYEGTKPQIAALRAAALEQAIFQVIPGAEQTATFSYDAEQGFRPKTEEQEAAVYAGFDASGALVGVALEAAGQGYADLIKILYGYDPQQEAVVGFQVLETKETPGLGDKIEKDPVFLANFEALDVKLAAQGDTLANKIITVKSGEKQSPWQIDGITGATISSRAIGDMLGKHTSEWIPIIQKHLDQLKK
jgi:electron transport complex protein RnfG